MIKVGGKPVFIKHMYDAGIKTVDDITDTDGTLLNLCRFRAKYPHVRINFLRLQSLKNAIPTSWKRLIKCDPRVLPNSEDKRCYLVNINENNKICLKTLRSRHTSMSTP